MGRYLSWDAYPSSGLAELECGGEAQLDPTATPALCESATVAVEQYTLPNSSLWFCTHGLPAALKAPDQNYVRVQFHRGGLGATWVNGQFVPVTHNQACISSSGVETDFCQDFKQVVWRIPRAVLIQNLAGQTGNPRLADLSFEPVLDLTHPQAAFLVQLLECLISALALEGGTHATIAALEQALLTAFLAASRRDAQVHREPRTLGAVPWQVHRVEQYVEENWRKMITMEDLVSVTGASARSIFRAFRQSRDYTPLEFARRTKLMNARRRLERAGDSDSVTAIAFACGFADLGRFSKDFVQAFGERPSVLLNRRKAARLESGDRRAGGAARATARQSATSPAR